MARTPRHGRQPRCSCLTGFTLIETLFTAAVPAIALALAAPSLGTLLQRQRLTGAMHLLTSQFAIARSTAVMRRVPVSVCPSLEGERCRLDSDWSSGWIMYLDSGRTAQPASSARILMYENAPATGDIRLLSSAGRRAIRFLPDGRSAGSNLTIRVCSADVIRGEVIVNNGGRTRSSRPKAAQPCSSPAK
jgi:type IV fimbrial biogenesis protein FimT